MTGTISRGGGSTIDLIVPLERAERELCAMARVVDGEIGLVARGFETLAGHADTIVSLAAAIVGRVENESIASVLPRVQALGTAARHFISERVQATAGILDTVTTEVRLLRQLSRVAGSQEAIALEIKALSVLTNIEVARLGAVGAGFQYLARDLSAFSMSVMEDTQELASYTHGRRTAIEQTRRVLLAEMPRLREELVRIEIDLGDALVMVDSGLTQLSRTPAQFRACVEDIARQVALVVSAIQTHDINRQVNEHVQQALALICARMSAGENSEGAMAQELARAYGGLAVQIHQLRTIKETVANWASQMRTCMSGILQASASDVVGIGPIVLEQERNVSSQLARIELLEHSSQGYSARMQHSIGGLSLLMQSVGEHLQRSKSIRDRLRMLAFNSIVEASHLGTQADAILAISKSIKGISTAWSDLTDRSGQAMQEIADLVKQTNDVAGSFSEASDEKLREAQVQTRSALDNLRAAAEFAASQAQGMKGATEKMQTKVAEVGKGCVRLDDCFHRLDAVLAGLEGLEQQLETEDPDLRRRYDAAEVEQLFSVFYTTEMESAMFYVPRSMERQCQFGKPRSWETAWTYFELSTARIPI